MTKTTRNSILFALALIVLIAVYIIQVIPKLNKQTQISQIRSFNDCAAAGYPIMESYPRQCKTSDGLNFVEQVATSTPALSDLIVVDSPKPNAIVFNPITIKGKARGTWYFEAVFPIQLVDQDGVVRGTGQAQAQGNWMTTEFVPYTATINFTPWFLFNCATKSGCYMPAFILLKKDNPSGLPQNEAELKIPVRVGPSDGSTAGTCKPTGCSGEICSDQQAVSSCIYRPEYACYKNATCERLSSGQCGWITTSTLLNCLYPNGWSPGPEPAVPPK